MPRCGEHGWEFVLGCSSCRVARRINRQLEEGTLKVEPVGQHEIKQFEREIQHILHVLGHAEAWVTDLSSVSDFGLNDKDIRAISKKLGVPVRRTDLLIDVALRLRKKDQDGDILRPNTS